EHLTGGVRRQHEPTEERGGGEQAEGERFQRHGSNAREHATTNRARRASTRCHCNAIRRARQPASGVPVASFRRDPRAKSADTFRVPPARSSRLSWYRSRSRLVPTESVPPEERVPKGVPKNRGRPATSELRAKGN